MKNRALITVLGAFGAAAIVFAGQAAALKRVVKVGDTDSYKMKIDLAVQGMQVNVSFDMTQKVTKVEPDGSYVMVEESKNQKVIVGGNEMPSEGDQVSTTTYAANGSVTKVESDSGMGDEHRLANLTTIIWPDKPVEVGSKWTAKIAGDKSKGTVDNEYTFEIQGKETVLGFETYRIAAVAKETEGGATATSTHHIDIKTGKTIKSTGQMKGVPIMGMPMDATFSLERTR